MRVTKLDTARAIVQALRREDRPVSPHDPEAVRMAKTMQVAQLEYDYKRAQDSNTWRRHKG